MKQFKDLLTLTALNRDQTLMLLDHAVRIKELTRSGDCPTPLAGKSVGLVFHKPSLRTRISFEVGVNQFGGNAIFITDKEIQLGVRETIEDAAKVLSRYLDMLVVRTFHQKDLIELARYADIPVINALTDLLHPCQVFCDLLTIKEKLGRVEDIKVAYFGDGNNMARSWINATKALNIDLWIATAPDTHPGEEFVREAANNANGQVTVTEDVMAAAKGADVLYTDVWASMGEKDKAAERNEQLQHLQLNDRLIEHANPKSLVMHCLPAERGREISAEAIDGPHSVVIDEAENRLHGQKSIMMWCLNAL